jgi:hypothetical protein
MVRKHSNKKDKKVDTFKGYVEASNQFTLHNIFTHIVYIIIPIRRHMFRKVNYWYPHMTNGNKRIYSLSLPKCQSYFFGQI